MISWLFYKLMLKKETYHTLNRVVLLACLAVSFILPFVPVSQKFSLIKESAVVSSAVKPNTYDEPTTTAIATPTPLKQPTVAAPTTNNLPQTTANSFDRENMVKWAFWIYWIGVVIFGVNLLIQLVFLSYKIFKSEVIYDGNYRIVELNDDKAPCSFGKYIFINPAKYEWETYNQILIHEKVHAQQYHTLDLIIAEIMVVFQWFNPLAWLYRKEIENNLEFLTDHTVIDRYKVKQDDYQLNLLKVSVPNYAMTITTNYNQSLLKQRIMMMNSRRSNIHIVWKYFAIIPLFICMISLLNKPVAISASIGQQLPPDTLKQKSKVVLSNKNMVSTKKTKTVKKAADQPLKSSNSINANSNYSVTSNSLPGSNLIQGNLLNTNSDYSMAVGRLNLKSALNIDRKNFTSHDIVTLRDSGVTAEYVKGINDAGYNRKFTSYDIIKLNKSGITAEYAKGISEAGFKNFTSYDIIQLNKNGVTAGFAKVISEAGFKNFTSHDIIKLQESGVTGSYIKGIADAGYKNFTSYDIIKLQKSGVTSSYAKGLSPK
jgi:beta-lactamase regulating signal transducer with metallopeptidase domain